MKRIVSLASVGAAAIAVLWLAGPAGASAGTGAAVSGTEYFQAVSTSTTSSSRPVIVYGVVTASGVDHEVGNVDTLVFPGGTFQVHHLGSTSTQELNPRTCLVMVTERGRYTLSGGTGKYAGISGHGTAQISILGIAARSKGGCSLTMPPLAFQQILTASGPAEL